MLQMWYEDIRAELPSIPFVIIGNKIDLEDQRVVSREDGMNKARDLKCAFMETFRQNGRKCHGHV